MPKGLESTLLQYTDLQKINQGVQIIHSRGNHWVLASTIGCSNTEVNIYDSLYESVDPDTLKIVQNRFSFSSDLTINVISEQKQTNIYDCGLFAIANATVIVFGENPIYHQFSVYAMRDHLIKCYKNKEMSPFPIGG